MGNPAPQSRSNSPKTNGKPKHRHSGSVSNISFTTEDPKPKHRHSGSASNISLTPEDLKPKHRQSGSFSSISLTPEDLKPKHRQSGSASNISLTSEDLKPRHRSSGSVSNISITPLPPEDRKDLKPKHRRSGSVSSSVITHGEDPKPNHRRSGSVSSSIITNVEDFTSPSRGDASRSSTPSSSVPSSSSAASLKERRKRRTRSSLGGTEDFVKELDFLTTPPNGRTPASTSTRKELLKPSPSPPLPESAPSQAASEALAPVPEASVSVHEKCFGKSPAPFEQSNDAVVEKVNVGENEGCPRGEKSSISADVVDGEKSFTSAYVGANGGSLLDEKSVSSANSEIVKPDNAARLAELESNGVDRGSTGTAETSRDEYHQAQEGEGDYEVIDNSLPTVENGISSVDHEVLQEILPILENGKLPETAASLPLVGTLSEEFDRKEPVCVRKGAQEAPEFIVERGLPTEFVVAVTGFPTEVSTESDNNESSVTGGTLKSSANGDSQLFPNMDENLSQEEQADKDTEEEEKVNVQKRIEELEKISGRRPVHFRSQSLSVPRQFDVSHARHHEAESSVGSKLPAYKAPLDSISVSELGGLEFAGASHEELAQGSFQREGPISTDGVLPTIGLGVDENSAEETESQDVPDFSEAHRAAHVSPVSMAKGLHVGNGTTVDSCEGLHSDEAESMAESDSTDVANAHANTIEQKEADVDKEKGLESGLGDAHANTIEQKEADVDKEKGLESGLGEAYVIVSADSVPKELHGPAPAGQTKENGGKLEIVEPPQEVLKSGTTLEARQMGALPVAAKIGMVTGAHQRGSSEVPSVQASVAEQSSQDYETTMLLTKQPAVDPLFIDSQQDRLWEMHSQEFAIEESSGQEVRESSAQDDDPRHYRNGTPTHAEVTPSSSAANGDAQSDKSSKVDRPRTPLRSLLAEEDAEKSPNSGPLGTPPPNQSGSPRGNLFKRIVSGGKNSPPSKQTTPSKFSPKNQTAAKPFLSSCMCCSVK